MEREEILKSALTGDIINDDLSLSITELVGS
jgi:hypothetical protein